MIPSESPLPYDFAEHRFRDASLPREALTHPAARRTREDGTPFDYERLEFLGDAVLGLILAEKLFADRPLAREGELSACRAAVVSRAALARVSRRIGLPAALDGGDDAGESARLRATESVAENLLEAWIGALYLDAGAEVTRRWVLDTLAAEIAAARPVDSPKNRLQELLQSRNPGANAGELVEYRPVGATGPDHARRFVVEVFYEDAVRGRGEGASVKAAEAEAARRALEAESAGA